jgi:hypothetical protein
MELEDDELALHQLHSSIRGYETDVLKPNDPIR